MVCKDVEHPSNASRLSPDARNDNDSHIFVIAGVLRKPCKYQNAYCIGHHCIPNGSP